MSSGFDWTDERIADLKRLNAEGLSHTQVAKRLGAPSRNAVAGKLHRLGLSRPKPEAAALGALHQKNTSKRNRRAAFPIRGVIVGTPPKPFVALPGTEPRDWETRGEDECRWPIDAPDGRFLSCCAPIVRSGYCAEHVLIAYEGPPTPALKYEKLFRAIEKRRATA